LKPTGKVYIFINEWKQFVSSHSQDFAEPYKLFISGSNSCRTANNHEIPE